MSKKNSSVKKFKKKFQENSRILDVYNVFKKNISFSKKNLIVVAVSGGADSLALSALTKFNQYDGNNKYFYVLIDHGYRKKSELEALKVRRMIKTQINENLTIIKNKQKFKNNLQKNFREIRYKNLFNFCIKKKAKLLMTAHHFNDQIETFLIRLARGSGVQGLSSMQMINKTNKKVKLIRPLLEIKKKELKFIAKKIFNNYLKDPSNFSKKFLRTNIRTLTSQLESYGISHDQIFRSIKNLNATNNLVNQHINDLMKKTVTRKRGLILIKNKNFFSYDTEIKRIIMGRLIKDFNKKDYPPRSKKISFVIKKFEDKSFNKLTLGGCVLKLNDSHITIQKVVKKT